MVATTKEGRLWSPGLGLTTLRRPSTTASPVPACRQGGPAMHRESTSCPPLSPAHQPFSTGHPPTHLPSSPRPGRLPSADIGKGGTSEGFRGGKEELGYGTMRHTTSGLLVYLVLLPTSPDIGWEICTAGEELSLPLPTEGIIFRHHVSTQRQMEKHCPRTEKHTHDLDGGIVACIWPRQEAAPTVVRHNSGEQERRA